MEIEDFCLKLNTLSLSSAKLAVSILWFHDRIEAGTKLKASQIAKIIHTHGIGNPNSAWLADAIKKTKLCHVSANGFSLKPTSRVIIEDWLSSILGVQEPKVDQKLGYIPESVWKNTRPYIERIAIQINGCFSFTYWDAVSVLIRRLIETLLIECYEHLNRQSEIKNGQEYMMLNGIINQANGNNGLPIGRDTKKSLTEIKTIGDRSAHNRYYTTVEADLLKIQSGVRVTVDELLQISNLKKT